MTNWFQFHLKTVFNKMSYEVVFHDCKIASVQHKFSLPATRHWCGPFSFFCIVLLPSYFFPVALFSSLPPQERSKNRVPKISNSCFLQWAHIEWNPMQLNIKIIIWRVHTPLFFVGRLPPIFLRVVVIAVVGAVVATATTDGRVCTIDATPPCQLLLSTRLIYVLPAN